MKYREVIVLVFWNFLLYFVFKYVYKKIINYTLIVFSGLAPVAGMCTATSSCTVNEGRHFESVYVVAHEIGHK